MEQFPDGAHVRLRSRVRRKYLHADKDGIGVFLSPVRASLNAVWRVHRFVRNGVPFVLLHGAAYGRYLAASDAPAPSGHRGQRVVQDVYDDPEANAVEWTVDGAGDGDDVLLRHVVSGGLLRANGRRRTWKNGVSVDHPDNHRSTMMHWVVEAVQTLPGSSGLFALYPHAQQVHSSGGVRFLARYRRHIEPFPERTIRYVRADYFGNFNNDHGWTVFQFEGHSLYTLWRHVASLEGHADHYFHIKLCTGAGCYGRLTPLDTDLPRTQLPMDIIALTTGSSPAKELQYPNVYVP